MQEELWLTVCVCALRLCWQMDIGVGAFIVSSAIVSSYARETRPSPDAKRYEAVTGQFIQYNTLLM